MKRVLLCLSLILGGSLLAQSTILPPHATAGGTRMLPGEELDAASKEKLTKEREELQQELLKTRAATLKKMEGKSEEERIKLFDELAEKQKASLSRIREIDAKTKDHVKAKREKALQERVGGKKE